MIAGRSTLTPAAESGRRSPPGSSKLEIQSRRSRRQLSRPRPESSPDCRRSTLRPGRRSPRPAPRARSSRPTAPTPTVKQAAELRTLTQRSHSAGARHGAGGPSLMPQVAEMKFNENPTRCGARRCGPSHLAAPQCSARSLAASSLPLAGDPPRPSPPASRRPAPRRSAPWPGSCRGGRRRKQPSRPPVILTGSRQREASPLLRASAEGPPGRQRPAPIHRCMEPPLGTPASRMCGLTVWFGPGSAAPWPP